MNLELLPSVNSEKTVLSGEETLKLVRYSEEHGLDPEMQLFDGRIIKRTLQEIVKSRDFLESLILAFD